MDDSTILIDNKAGAKADSPIRFGMSSFGINEREKLGQSLRLASSGSMSLKVGKIAVLLIARHGLIPN